MITYQVERWNDIVHELAPFFSDHWVELGVTKETVPLDVDWTQYYKLDEMQLLHTVTVRIDKKLVGYHVSIITPHLHYKSTKHAHVDIYYVAPKHRNGRVGMKLFEFVEQDLKSLGVQKIITSCKAHSDHTRLFEHMGYLHTDILFAKIIK